MTDREKELREAARHTPEGQLLVRYGFEPWDTESAARRVAEKAAAEIAQLQARIDNITAQGVHSCHDGCQRPLCVMRRERDAARKQVEELSLIVEDFAKGILLLQLSRLEFDQYAAQAASGRLLPEDLFRYGWRLLCRVAREEGHCLTRGCGRDTLAYWVFAVCKVRNPAWFYRRVLREAVRRGWATKTTSPHGYSIFSIAPRAAHKTDK